MSTFWYTDNTMLTERGEDYTAFSLFDGTHLFWLGFAVLFIIAICFFYRRSSSGMRRKMEIGLGAAIVFCELFRQCVVIFSGQWLPETLPLHLCSYNIGICMWYGIHPTKLAANILYTLCIPGAAVALLSPSWMMLPIWNFSHIDSELTHILLLTYPIMLVAGGFRPDIRYVPKIIGGLLCLCAVIYPLNVLLGTNFLFITDPYGNAITCVCTSIFGAKLFILGYVILLVIIVFLMHTPFVLINLYKKKHRRCDSLIT
ncbi:MAG: YwaF family protein [Oscillospiraceae bacterium]|nr:YwaF family protein [Oscillospiraceae bacterium]